MIIVERRCHRSHQRSVSRAENARREGGRAAPAVEPSCPLPNGMLVAHKPYGWSSMDVCAKLRSTLEW